MEHSMTDSCFDCGSLTQSTQDRQYPATSPKCLGVSALNPSTYFQPKKVYQDAPSVGFEVKKRNDTAAGSVALYPQLSLFVETLSQIKNELQIVKENQTDIIKLNFLVSKRLRSPLDVVIEPDTEGFIARSVDLPLFGYGEDRIEAIDALKSEIESLYYDLMEDDDFTEEWLVIKHFFNEQIIDS